MKTRKANWDYQQNTYLLSAEDISRIDAVKDEFEAVKQSLIEIIGQREYNSFVYNQPIWFQTNMRLLTAEIQHELDYYGCSCNPIDEPCPGCQHRYEVQRASRDQDITN